MKSAFLTFALMVGASLTISAQDFVLQAHRGIADVYPENTVLSFRKAAEVPVYVGMETDLQMTKDGILVCMHDDKIDRTTDGTGLVSDYTFEELQKFWIDGGYGWDPKYEKTLKIPAFWEYLEACKEGGLKPYVELKTLPEEGICKAVQMLSDYGFDGNYVITSFKWKLLVSASKFTDAPLEYMKATGKYTKADVDACSEFGHNMAVRPKSTDLTPEFVDYCHSKGLVVECYGVPVGDAELVEKLVKMGVVGGTCNNWTGLGLKDRGTLDKCHKNRKSAK